LILERFAGKKKVHFHKHLSPNDENISFGQLVAYDRDLYKKENNSISITNQ
jgi:hydrogenase maturation factor HypF (carbamoyltransferase family)